MELHKVLFVGSHVRSLEMECDNNDVVLELFQRAWTSRKNEAKMDPVDQVGSPGISGIVISAISLCNLEMSSNERSEV